MAMNRSYFMALVAVSEANPNGDPLNGNRPRQHADGKGYITDVCIKRKMRNRMQDMGRKILIVSDDRCEDDINSIHARLDSDKEFAAAEKEKDTKLMRSLALATYEDVRAFGATLALKKGSKTDSESKNGVSVGIRAAVTIQEAESIDSVDIESTQITKSTNGETEEKKGLILLVGSIMSVLDCMWSRDLLIRCSQKRTDSRNRTRKIFSRLWIRCFSTMNLHPDPQEALR